MNQQAILGLDPGDLLVVSEHHPGDLLVVSEHHPSSWNLDASYTDYLPTFTPKMAQMYRGKYSIHGACGEASRIIQQEDGRTEDVDENGSQFPCDMMSTSQPAPHAPTSDF